MEMMMAVDVVHHQTRRLEALELGADFRLGLTSHFAREEQIESELLGIVKEPAVGADEIGHLLDGQYGHAVDQHDMKANTKSRQASRAADSVRESRSAGHQARGRKNAVAVPSFDGFVDRNRDAEIVGGHDQRFRILQSSDLTVVNAESIENSNTL